MSPRSYRVTAAVFAGVLLLASCGDPKQSAGTTTPSSTLPTIRVASASASAESRSASPAPMAAGQGSAVIDSKMIAAWEHYTHSGPWPDMPASATAYQLRADGLDATRVTQMAAAFGLTGSAVAIPQNEGGGWRVGPTDGSGPMFAVWNSPTADWSYASSYVGTACVDGAQTIEPAPAPAVDPVAPDAVPPETVGGMPPETVSPDAPLPAPPTPIDPACAKQAFPPGPELVSTAERVMQAAGLGTWQFDVSSAEYGYLVGTQDLDGKRSPMTLSFSFDHDGAITFAEGSLATARPVGDYPLITPDEALQRLNDRSQMYVTGMGVADSGVAAPAIAASAGDAQTPGTAVDVPAPQPIDPQPVEPQPVEPQPVERVERAVTDVRLGLLMHWDVDNVVWLVPAYEFLDGEVVVASISAVTDEYFQIEGTAVDPGVSEPAVPEPAPFPRPGADDAPAQSAPPDVIGLGEDEAGKVLEQAGWQARVIKIDGEGLVVTADYSTTRLNLEIDKGIVVATSVG